MIWGAIVEEFVNKVLSFSRKEFGWSGVWTRDLLHVKPTHKLLVLNAARYFLFLVRYIKVCKYVNPNLIVHRISTKIHVRQASCSISCKYFSLQSIWIKIISSSSQFFTDSRIKIVVLPSEEVRESSCTTMLNLFLWLKCEYFLRMFLILKKYILLFR